MSWKTCDSRTRVIATEPQSVAKAIGIISNEVRERAIGPSLLDRLCHRVRDIFLAIRTRLRDSAPLRHGSDDVSKAGVKDAAGIAVGWMVILPLAAMLAAIIAGITASALALTTAGEGTVLRARVQPAVEARQVLDARIAERPALAATLEGRPVSNILAALARALPADAHLRAVQQDGSGDLQIDIVTVDPDMLPSAIAREPALYGLIQTQQRPDGAGRLIVTLKSQRP